MPLQRSCGLGVSHGYKHICNKTLNSSAYHMFSNYLPSRKHSVALLKVFLLISVPLALMQLNTHPMTSGLVIILVCLLWGGRNSSWFASSHPLAFSLCVFPSYLPSTAILVLLARRSVDCQVPCWHCWSSYARRGRCGFVGGFCALSPDFRFFPVSRSPLGTILRKICHPVARVWGSVWRRLPQSP